MEEKYKILIVSQYFWPENFRINDLAKSWRDKGYEVDVLTGKPNFPGGKLFKNFKKNPGLYSSFHGSRIYRMPIFYRGSGTRLEIAFNYMSFLISALVFSFFKLRKKNYQIIFTFGISPITVAIISNFLSWMIGSKTVLWVLDLWPDILKELGVIKSNIIYGFFKGIVKKIYSSSDLIFAQSNSMRHEINSIVKSDKASLLSSWPEKINYLDGSYTKKISVKEEDLNLMFTGTLGEYQNLEEVIDAISEMENEKIKMFIIGGGRHRKVIEKYIKLKRVNNILMIDNQPLEEMPSFVNLADILVVSLQQGKVGSYTIPGKVQTYINFKKPILAHISGETMELVKKYNLGLSSKPGEKEKLKENIRYFAKLKKNHNLKREFNFSGTDTIFNIENSIKILDNNFKSVVNSEKIRLVTSAENIPFDKNFILSGLNLAFLGHYFNKEIDLQNNLYNWPDGIFSKISDSRIKKMPGKNLILNLKLPEEINKIFIIGNLSKKGKTFMEDYFKVEIIHYNLPFGSISEIKKKLPKINFTDKDVIFLTLPTPKQEQIAKFISENSNYYKILCIGGAINMLCGDEKPVPKILEKNFEFLWRLRFDTRRRFRRLVKSFIVFFIKGILFSRVKKIKFNII